MDNEKKRLIIGLGNPGTSYQASRHNAGFMVVESFALKQRLTFKHASHVCGELAQGTLEGMQVFVLKPLTFMNESGLAVRHCIDYYKVPIEHLIVVTDDAALPLGSLRMRTKGSSGGHNGLFSIETHIHTQEYARFRIGIGRPAGAMMKDYVLSAFNSEESRIIAETIGQAILALELWVTAGIATAMQKANAKIEVKGDNNNDQAKGTSL